MTTVSLVTGVPLVGVSLLVLQSSELPPAIQGVGDIGSFLMGIGAAVAAIGWVVKTFRTGKAGNGESALGAERRTTTAVEKVFERIDLVREEMREGQKENRHDVRNALASIHGELMNAIRELRRP